MTKAEEMKINALIDNARELLDYAEDGIADAKFYLNSLEKALKEIADKEGDGEDED